MRSFSDLRRRGAVLAAAALAAASLPAVVLTAGPVGAATSQNGADMVVINPGGGADPTGADGIQIILNGNDGFTGTPGASYSVPEDGSDQFYFADTGQWCCDGASPQLNIGGTLYGEAGAAADQGDLSFGTTEIVSVSGSIGRAPEGSDTLDDSTAEGSGSAHIRYTVEHGGLTYTLDRFVTYVYPNNYFIDTYQVTIPAGNTEIVKFYIGGDAAPGDNDNGKGIGIGPGFSTSAPLDAAYEVNPDSEIFVAYGEIRGGGEVTGLYAGEYSDPVFIQISNGADIGFVVDVAEHDAGLDLQWTVGTTPGVYTFSQKTTVGFQGANVTAYFAPFEINADEGETSDLVFEIVNTKFESQSGGFTVPLPAGVTVTGTPVNTCGGTASVEGGVLTVSGVSLASASVCSVTLPVTAPPGEYTFSEQTIDPSGDLEVGFGEAFLIVNGTPAPPAPEPEPAPRFVG
jgi:hypothetical protein